MVLNSNLSAEEMADKIYKSMEVMAHVSVFGFVRNAGTEEIEPKGEAVMKYIKMYYENDYCDEVCKRKYKFKPHSVGGPVAHPIFISDKKVVEGEVRVNIWRVQ